MLKKKLRMGQEGPGMFDWAKTSPGSVDPRTGRVVGEFPSFGLFTPLSEPTPTYAPPRFAQSYSSREMDPYRGRQQQAAPGMFSWAGQAPQSQPGMFSWVSPGQSGRMSGPGGSSAALWVGLSIAVGAGLMIALEATGVTNITRSAPKA